MNLKHLIEQYERVQARLVSEIQSEANEVLIRKLDYVATETCSIIAQIHLTNPLEINQQIKFFMNRSRSIDHRFICESDFQTIDNLIDRYTNRASIDPSHKSLNSIFTHSVIDAPANELSSLRKSVEGSEARVSLFDLDYRYIQTSIGNAKFHFTTPSEFDYRPLVDVVGSTRFMSRAKAYLDRTFTGKPQRYNYFLNVPEQGERLMSCQLKPFRDADGSVRGAIFEISDVTEQINELHSDDTHKSFSTSEQLGHILN